MSNITHESHYLIVNYKDVPLKNHCRQCTGNLALITSYFMEQIFYLHDLKPIWAVYTISRRVVQ